MPTLELEAKTLNDLQAVSEQLLAFAGSKRIFCFDAEMGSGKTTLITALCKTLGVTTGISSPTYAIVNEYLAGSTRVFHFDLYRLRSLEELLDIGFEDYIHSGAYCFIEWPQLSADLFHGNQVNITISVKENIRYFRATI